MSDYGSYGMQGAYHPMEIQPLPSGPHLPDNMVMAQESIDMEAFLQSIAPQPFAQHHNPFRPDSSSGAGPSNHQQHSLIEGDRDRQINGYASLSEGNGNVAAQLYSARFRSDARGSRASSPLTSLSGEDGRTPTADMATLEQSAYANGMQGSEYISRGIGMMEGYSPSPEHKIKRPRPKKQQDVCFIAKRKRPMTEEEKRQQAEAKVQQDAERKRESERKKELKRSAAEEQRAMKKATKLKEKMEIGTKSGLKNGSNGKRKGKESAEKSGASNDGQGMSNGTTLAMADQALAYAHIDDLDRLRSIHDQLEGSIAKRPRSEDGDGLAEGGDDIASGPSKKTKKGKKKKVKEDLLSRPAKQISGRAMPVRESHIKEILRGQREEIQLAPCQRPRYRNYPKCFHCIRKSVGDVCRFRGFRRLPIDPDTTEIIGQPNFADMERAEEQPPLVTKLNRPLQLEDVFRIKKCVASTILPQLTRELRHVALQKAMTRPLDLDDRANCDFCSATIFAGSFFCRTCGREYCLDCDGFIAETKEDMRSSRLPLADDARPRMMGCLGRTFHCRPDFIPISRLRESDARRHWLALVHFALDAGLPVMEQLAAGGADLADLASDIQARQPVDRDFIPPGELDDHAREMKVSRRQAEVEGQFYTNETRPTQPRDIAGLPCHPFMRLDHSQLDDTTFEALWQKGEPIVTDGLLDRFKEDWSPEAFSQRAEQEFLAVSERDSLAQPEMCTIVDCQTNAEKQIPVQEFFNRITAPKETRGERVWKLKDWPTDSEFRTKFPSLYQDFLGALPVPDFTRRDGVINIASFFPDIRTQPDIGPKMYNAFTGKETVDGLGTTRLHMDMADAINVMLYANEPTPGVTGCAVWDIYRSEDANEIREFLSVRFKNYRFHDPIHSQIFYMNEAIRRELFEEKGVFSFRIYQYPGQAVFIPAGCAHQVCNLGDCVKIACDFVSPHNVQRCGQLTDEFRGENIRYSWKTDVLQYNNTLWYAWLSANAHEKRILHPALANGDKASGSHDGATVDDTDEHTGIAHPEGRGHADIGTLDRTLSLADANANAESTIRPSDDDPMALVTYVQSRTNLSKQVDEPPMMPDDVPTVGDGIEIVKDDLAERVMERVLKGSWDDGTGVKVESTTGRIDEKRPMERASSLDPTLPLLSTNPENDNGGNDEDEITPLPTSTEIPDLPMAMAEDTTPPLMIMDPGLTVIELENEDGRVAGVAEAVDEGK